MSKEKRMETARTWLRLARKDGDENTKRQFLKEKGFSSEELEELLEWDRKDSGWEPPLFG